MDTWHLYLVRCADGSLYTGITTDVERRFDQHELGQGAKFLRGRGPLELMFRAPVGGRGEALRAELRVKALSKRAKLALIAGSLAFGDLLEPVLDGSEPE